MADGWHTSRIARVARVGSQQASHGIPQQHIRIATKRWTASMYWQIGDKPWKEQTE